MRWAQKNYGVWPERRDHYEPRPWRLNFMGIILFEFSLPKYINIYNFLFLIYLFVIKNQDSRIYPVYSEWILDPVTFQLVCGRNAPKGVK